MPSQPEMKADAPKPEPIEGAASIGGDEPGDEEGRQCRRRARAGKPPVKRKVKPKRK